MGKKYSDSIAIFTCVIILVSLIIFLALSFKDSNSKDPDRERIRNATTVKPSFEEFMAASTKAEIPLQGSPESEGSEHKESNGSNKTPAEIMVKEIEKNIRLESNPD